MTIAEEVAALEQREVDAIAARNHAEFAMEAAEERCAAALVRAEQAQRDADLWRALPFNAREALTKCIAKVRDLETSPVALAEDIRDLCERVEDDLVVAMTERAKAPTEVT